MKIISLQKITKFINKTSILMVNFPILIIITRKISMLHPYSHHYYKNSITNSSKDKIIHLLLIDDTKIYLFQ